MKPIKVIGVLILVCIAVESAVIGMFIHDYWMKPRTMTAPVVEQQVQEQTKSTKQEVIYGSLPYQQWIMRTQVKCLQREATMQAAHRCMMRGGIVI